MRKVRVAVIATTLSLIAAVASMGSAGAATPGVGTTKTGSTLLGVQLGTNGDLLGIKVLADEAQATIDSAVSAPSAFAKFAAVKLSSKVVPALNITVPNPVAETRTPGGLGSVTTGTSLGGIPLPVLGGSLTPATLTSALDSVKGANSTLNGSLLDITALGGLLSLDSVTSKMGATAGSDFANSDRGLDVDALSVLDLGALLDGLGLGLADLTIPMVSDLLEGLGIGLGNVTDGDLNSFVDAANDTLDGLQDLVADLTNEPLLGTVNSGLGGLGIPALPALPVDPTLDQVNAAIDTLQNALANVLEGVLAVLDDLSLLSVDGVEVGTVTKATDTLSDSVADVTAKIGAVKVGGITLPGVDLTSTLTQVNGLVNSVTGTVSGALGAINPGLANLIDIDVLDQVESVVSEGGYNRARAGITALSVSITPPVNLSSIVSTVTGLVGIGESITGLGGTVPALTGMGGLGTLLNLTGAVEALSGGASIKVAEVLSASDFAVLGAPVAVPGGTLPRTGDNNTAMLAGIAMVLAALALGIRRWVATPANVD